MNDTATNIDAAASALLPMRMKPRGRVVRLLSISALLLLGCWLGWKAWGINTKLACWKNEWPGLEVCNDVNGRSVHAKVAQLERRLALNPGDAAAQVALAVHAHQIDAPSHLDPIELLTLAVRSAPQQGEVLRMQAHQAMRQQQWVMALDPLIRLSQHHRDAQATRTLTELINYAQVDGKLGWALVQAAHTDPGWLERVLRALPQSKVPTSLAMPLVQPLIDQQKLTPSLGMALVRQLKAEGSWLDAHALWMRLWGRPLPLLFNGDFEQPFVTGGFDWETAVANDHRAGILVSRVGREDRGHVLRVEFRGRPISTPVLSQTLMLPPGRYQFTGEYQSVELRSDQGVTWIFSCAETTTELARTPPLSTTGREWRQLAQRLDVPAACRFGVRLSLQPQSVSETRTGIRGEMLFDRFELALEQASP